MARDLKFWWDVLRRIPRLAWDSLLHADAIISVVALAIPLLDIATGEQITKWLGIHRRWLWLLLAVIFVHLLAKSIRVKFNELEAKVPSGDSDRLLAEAYSAGRALFNGTPEVHEINQWIEQTQSMIASHFGSAEAEVFLNNFGYTFRSESREKNAIDGRLRRLQELIGRQQPKPRE